MFSSAAASTLLSFANKGFEWYKEKRDFLEKIKLSDEIKSVIALHKKYLAKITLHREASLEDVSDGTVKESTTDFLPPIFVRVEEDPKEGSPGEPVFRSYLSSEAILENLDPAEWDIEKDDNPDLRQYKEAISEAIEKLFSFYKERIKPSCVKSLLLGRNQSEYKASDSESTVFCYLLFFLSKNFINFSGGKTDISCLVQLESFVKKYIELHKNKHELVKHLTSVGLLLKKAVVHLKKHNIFLEFESRVKHLLNCSRYAAKKMILHATMLLEPAHDEVVTLSELADEKSTRHNKIFSTESQLSESIIQCARYYKKLNNEFKMMDFKKMADKKITDIFGKSQNFLTGLPGKNAMEKVASVFSHFFSVILMLISVGDLAQRLWGNRAKFVMDYEENFPHLYPVFQDLEKLNKAISQHKMALLLAFREMDHEYMQHGIIPIGDFGTDAEEVLRHVENNAIESLNSIINKYRFYPDTKLETEITPQVKELVMFANQVALMHQVKMDESEKFKLATSTYSPRHFKAAGANSGLLPPTEQQDEQSALMHV